MRLLIILSTVLITCLLLGSCSKTNKVLEPGITYGITGIEPQTAANGDTLTIYGAGFSTDVTGNTVTIHGVNATVVAAKAQALQVIVPSAPRNGTVDVKTGSKSASDSSDPFILETAIAGTISKDSTWNPAYLYLLKGAVHVQKGATLTILAGTSILGEKRSQASLTIDDGATVLMNGTAVSPVVFSSDQLVGLRLPGDWGGITLAAASGAPADKISYTRIEYAGNHPANQPGAALLINRPVPAANLQYVEASYSNGDGFRSNATDGSVQYLKYLVAFGCAGNDFAFEGNSRAIGQFLFGIKDALYADALGSDGLLDQSSLPVTVSNLTLVGYNDLARNVTGQTTYNNNLVYKAENPNSGRGVHVGGANYNGQVTTGTLQLFNSLVAAPFLAGISIDGPAAWSQYEDGTNDATVIRNTTVTQIILTGYPLFPPPIPPVYGYSFASENLNGPLTGFQPVTGTAQQTAFNQYNDSATLMMTQYPGSFVTYVDDLGIQNMVLYKRLTAPVMSPQTGSPLFTGADFTNPSLADPFFDASGTFRGSFGTNDWTKGWTNYTPQQTAY